MSATPDRLSELLHSIQSCKSNVKAWATANMLKLNDNNTELMLITSKRTKHLHNIPTSITMGNAQVPFKQSVKYLGFTLDCHHTMNAHVTNIARTCYFELRRLAFIRRFLTSTATATLVSTFALSRIDCCNSLLFGSTHDFTHTSFEVVQASITLQHNTVHFLCLYRPPPNRRNNLTDSMFTEQQPDLLDYVNSLPGFVCHVGDMNIHFGNPLQSLTKQTLSTLSLYNLVQVINKPTHRCGHIIDWVIVRADDSMTYIENLLLQTHLNQTTIALNPTSIFQSLSILPSTGLLGTLLTLTAHHLLLNFPVSQSFHLMKIQACSVTICALY